MNDSDSRPRVHLWKWYVVPVLVVFVLVAALILIGGPSAPVIYTLF